MNHDDFKVEPIRGLPEALPEGEHILWQGSPKAGRLAIEALNLRWIAGYFGLLAVWRFGVSTAGVDTATALGHAVPFVVIGLVACGLLMLVAWIQARATVYTLTNKRVAMRIGAALTMTLNLPYTCIGTARLDVRRGGTGTLAFELLGNTRLSPILTWPHIRPWHFFRVQPALRCIADAATVAQIFGDAAETRISQPVVSRTTRPEGGMAVAAE